MRRIRRQRSSSKQDTAASVQALEDNEYLRRLVSQMADLAARSPDLQDIAFEDALVAEGIDRLVARRLVAFVPMAFGEVLVAGLGLQPGTEFMFRDESGRWRSKPLRTVPEYVAAESLISTLAGTPGFRVLAIRDSRVALVNKVLSEGESLDSVKSWRLTPPALVADGADLGIS